jgi:hypothetical protein
MADDDNKATIICPTCRHTTERDLGWLKTVPVWDCPFCGAALEIDQDRLAAFAAEAPPRGAGFTARLSPRPNRGITTRRTR